MKCGCLEKIKKLLSDHHKTEVDLDLKMAVNIQSGKMFTDLPPLYYHYFQGKKKKKGYMNFNYCPFCGKKDASG